MSMSNGDGASPQPYRALLMVWDGLRPDLINEQVTPNLFALAAGGVRFANSHAVYPTMTRVNASSIATGCLPGKHGIPSNGFFALDVLKDRYLNTGQATDLELLRPARGDRVLLRAGYGELLAAAGGKSVIASTGSPGSTLLQHPEAARTGDVHAHPTLLTGITKARIEERLGPMPRKSMPNTAQNRYFTKLITDVLLPEEQPSVLAYWHCDPDHTQHEHGIGHPTTVAALRDADENLGLLLAGLKQLGLEHETNVIVTSDHGFSTITNRYDLTGSLISKGLKVSVDSVDVRVLPDMIYVEGHQYERITALAGALLADPAVGPVFSGSWGNPVVPGTLAMSLTGVDGGPDTPDLLFSPAWSGEENEHGFAGTCTALWPYGEKGATHGSISPWDIRNTLIAAGPAFKRGVISAVPAGNLDIMPTLLHLCGIPAPDDIDGRVLHEALVGGPAPSDLDVLHEGISADSDHARHIVALSHVAGTTYLDYGRTERPE